MLEKVLFSGGVGFNTSYTRLSGHIYNDDRLFFLLFNVTVKHQVHLPFAQSHNKYHQYLLNQRKMVKCFFNTYTYALPWHRYIYPLYFMKFLNYPQTHSVINAWWNKYPNVYSSQIVGVDTISRSFNVEDQTLVTRRLISTSFHPVAWMVALGFPTYCYVLEEATMDMKKHELVISSVNVTGAHMLQVWETCKYFINPENDSETIFEGSANITTPIPIVTNAIENYCLGIHSNNANKGLTAMQNICDEFFKAGAELKDNIIISQILNWRLDVIQLLNELKVIEFKFE